MAADCLRSHPWVRVSLTLPEMVRPGGVLQDQSGTPGRFFISPVATSEARARILLVGLFVFAPHGTGAEVMQRIAVPMIGGMVSSTLLTLVVIPAIYAVVKGLALPGSVRFDHSEPLPQWTTPHQRGCRCFI